MSKSCAPFTFNINEVNNAQIYHAGDDNAIYNLIKYTINK